MNSTEWASWFSTRRVVWALAIGFLWGAFGYALAGPWLGVSVWGGVALSPVIGLAIGFVFREFSSRPPGQRIALALVSLYLAAGLFGLAAGIADASRPIPHRIPGAVVIQSVFGVWWGVTFMGYLPLLWVLSYLTHWALGRVGPRRPADAAIPPEVHGQGPTAAS